MIDALIVWSPSGADLRILRGGGEFSYWQAKKKTSAVDPPLALGPHAFGLTEW